MQFNIKHPEMVARLIKDPKAIVAQLTLEHVGLIHSGMGVCGEAGELIDAIKKHTIYNKPIDRENIVEELGDLEFYMEDIRRRLSISREETLAANMEKLAKRYPGFGFTDQRAHERADKLPVSYDESVNRVLRS